jgi:acyl-CoA synthetase (AMP-forming)/AMP-acid ligase II
MYGATEASARLTYLPPNELRRKLGSIGRPIPNTEVVVVKDDGERAAAGEIGELVARGANVACGYWNNAEETNERFSALGYRTGDLGYADEEGYLFLVGRRHDMIKVGAHRVGAKEIEDVLHDYPGVHEVAVVGSAHEILGEVPVAFVAMRTDSTSNAEELRAFCATRLPAYKIPTRVHFYPELPKSSSAGKIDKVALRAAAASENPAASGAGQQQ